MIYWTDEMKHAFRLIKKYLLCSVSALGLPAVPAQKHSTLAYFSKLLNDGMFERCCCYCCYDCGEMSKHCLKIPLDPSCITCSEFDPFEYHKSTWGQRRSNYEHILTGEGMEKRHEQ